MFGQAFPPHVPPTPLSPLKEHLPLYPHLPSRTIHQDLGINMIFMTLIILYALFLNPFLRYLSIDQISTAI